VAANTTFSDPAVYTYASPRTGDSLFAATYDQVIKNSQRIVNRLDIVPALPPTPPYEHVLHRYELNPVQLAPPPPRVLVEFTPYCEHSLVTYLHLLSLQSGGPAIPLESTCRP
jgi:Lipase (class 3)